MSDLRDNLLRPERRAEAAKEQAERAARHPDQAFVRGLTDARAARADVERLTAEGVEPVELSKAYERFTRTLSKTRHPAYATFQHGQARAQAALAESGAALAAQDDLAFALARERYAEAMALQGQYALALANSSDPLRRADYQAHARALEYCNVKLCACPPVVRQANDRDAKGERIETQHPVAEVWDSERGKVVTFTRCRLCKVLSCRA